MTCLSLVSVENSMKLIIDLTFLFTFLITMNSGSPIKSVFGLLIAFDPESGISPGSGIHFIPQFGITNLSMLLD